MSRHQKKKQYNSKNFLEELAKSIKIDDSENLVEWINNNDLVTEDNLPYTFENRTYLIDIMNDTSKKQVIVSSAQVGKTIMMYIKAIYQAMNGKNIVYSLPTQDLSDLMVKSKLNRLIDNNPVFKSIVKGDNLREKQVKDRMIYSVYTNGTLNVGFSTD